MDDLGKFNRALGVNSIFLTLFLGMTMLLAHVTGSWRNADILASAVWFIIGSMAYLAARLRFGWKKDAQLKNIFLLMAGGTVTVSVILVHGRSWSRKPVGTREEDK